MPITPVIEVVFMLINVSIRMIVSDVDNHTPFTHVNEPTSRPSLPTPIRFDVLEELLVGFDPKKLKLLKDGFENGFKIFYEGDESGGLDSKNSKSTELHPEAVQAKLDKELELGRIAGPFDEKPFGDSFKCFPLAIREKSTPGQYRLLHNLSYPYDSQSVNYNIPKNEATCQYITVRDIMDVARKIGKKGWMAKADIKDAFRLLPLNPEVYHLMGFSWKGKYYYDKCLPMGCSSSCRLFSTFTDAIAYILKEHYGVENSKKILDDFFFGAVLREECQRSLACFLDLCDISKIPVVPHKTVQPCWCLTFMGAEFDTELMQVRLPEDKLIKYSCHIDEVISAGEVTLRELQSIIGQLQYATSVVNVGKAFLRRLINLTIGKRAPHSNIKLTNKAKSDLVLWKFFLQNFNGVSFMYEPHFAQSHTINLYSDASKLHGYGGCYGTSWIQGRWPESWKGYHINILEFYPILALVETFGHKLRNSTIKFYCDNKSVVGIINKQSSKSNVIMIMMRRLVLKLLDMKTKFTAVHIPGVSNILSDAISRFQENPVLLRNHRMALTPTPIAESSLPQNVI